MDFELSDDQKALAAAIHALGGGRFSLERIRRFEEAATVVDPEDWAALGEAGVFPLTLPQSRSGVGLALAEAAVVFEKLGRDLVPGPLVGSFLGSRIAEGAAEGIAVTGVVARPVPPVASGGGALPTVVSHLDTLAALVVLAPPASMPGAAPAGAALVEVDALDAVPVAHSLDPLAPLWVLPGGLPAGEPFGDPTGADLEDESAATL